MKIKITAIAAVLSLHFAGATVAQPALEIEWQEPNKFTDVKPTNQTRKRFIKSTLNELEEYLQSLVVMLPAEHKLVMKVTNLDLAGQVWPASFVGVGSVSTDVRIVKNIDIPRIHFSYQLIDGQGQQIKQAEVDLKDMSFLDRSNRLFKNDSLKYEKNMLKRWFEKEFEQQLKPKQETSELAAN
ncbi:DUF3016 domain-containing protein [Paraglaciecola aestuariivivens]